MCIRDRGRAHRRRGIPSAATRSLLSDFHDAMRGELRAILDALAAVASPGIVEVVGPPPLVIPLEDARRGTLWARAVMLGRELGTEVDPPPATDTKPPEARPRRRRTEW